MNTNRDNHLAYDELIRNLVNKDDLVAIRRAHLNVCPQCRHQVAAIGQGYHRLGEAARRLAPCPSRAFRIPQNAVARRSRRFVAAMAMGLASAFILGVAIFWSHGFHPGRHPSQVAWRSAEKDRQLMARVDDLVRDALPESYQRLLAGSEPIMTEDLMDWVVPPEETDQDAEPPA